MLVLLYNNCGTIFRHFFGKDLSVVSHAIFLNLFAFLGAQRVPTAAALAPFSLHFVFPVSWKIQPEPSQSRSGSHVAIWSLHGPILLPFGDRFQTFGIIFHSCLLAFSVLQSANTPTDRCRVSFWRLLFCVYSFAIVFLSLFPNLLTF